MLCEKRVLEERIEKRSSHEGYNASRSTKAELEASQVGGMMNKYQDRYTRVRRSKCILKTASSQDRTLYDSCADVQKQSTEEMA